MYGDARGEDRTAVRDSQPASSMPLNNDSCSNPVFRDLIILCYREEGGSWVTGWGIRYRGPGLLGKGNNTLFLGLPNLREFGRINYRKQFLDK